MNQPTPCPVCKSVLPDGRHDYGTKAYFKCPRCGLFGLTSTAEATLANLLDTPRKAAVLSYAIRQTRPAGRDTPVFDPDACKKVVEEGFLPTPHEQADHLIRWLGEHQSGPGESIRISFETVAAVIGALSFKAYRFVLAGLVTSGFVQELEFTDGTSDVQLLFAGWARFEQLRRGAPTGRKAFMAMQYGDALLDRVVNEHFRPAVAETGFVLRRLDDHPQAGLIDDRLRVEIQSARFLIVDLTNKNAGAYWEAGYAEGLGKPVIYTCRRPNFHEDSHFDTNHHLHVLWDESDLKAAATQLQATIRATMPEAMRGSE